MGAPSWTSSTWPYVRGPTAEAEQQRAAAAAPPARSAAVVQRTTMSVQQLLRSFSARG
jgi:hypothetical protein